MPGYILVEQKMLAPSKPNGIAPYASEMGLLDFLRELAADDFPFPRFGELRVFGLEQVLYASRPDETARALDIRHHLQQSAQNLQSNLLTVQVVFEGELHHGESLWSDYRGQRLPIGHIFGSPPPYCDPNGNRAFLINFNLTS